MEAERQILVTACDIDPEPDRQEKLRRLVSHDFDANRLIELAIKEGAGGLLYRNLKKAGVLDSLDVEDGQRLQAVYYETIRSNLMLMHDIKALLGILDQKGIPVVLMKGIALLQTVYEDIGLRPMSDIDLWVLPADYHGLKKTLLDQGFQKETFYPYLYKKGKTVIDVHTHFLWADRIKASSLLVYRSQESIFRNAQEINVEGEKALCLSRYDQVLYLSLHVLKHFAERLIWFVDIKILMESWTDSDWEALKHRADELGLKKVFAYFMYLLEDLLDYQIPSEGRTVKQEINLSKLEKTVLKKRKRKNELPIWSQFFLLPSGKGLYRKIAFVLETLFPRPEILRQVFAGSPHLKTWQLYWRRSLQLLGFNRTF